MTYSRTCDKFTATCRVVPQDRGSADTLLLALKLSRHPLIYTSRTDGSNVCVSSQERLDGCINLHEDVSRSGNTLN
jgi:hypothetical protein